MKWIHTVTISHELAVGKPTLNQFFAEYRWGISANPKFDLLQVEGLANALV